ncbi:MAG: toprim domain-containing protein [Candidatus Bathyarchaeia archaeon]
MTSIEKYNMLIKLAGQLIEESKKGIPIIVEGRKDLTSLKRIGVKGRIRCVKSRRLNFINLVDELKEEKETIIMTDFDREGEELAHQLSIALTESRVKVNNMIREKIRSLFRNEIKAVEELANFYYKAVCQLTQS